MRAHTEPGRGIGAGPALVALLAVLLAIIAGAGKALPASAAPGEFGFEDVSLSVVEGETLAIDLVRTGGDGVSSFVEVAVVGGTADPADYNFPPTVPQWNASQTSLSVSMPTFTDADDADETIILALSLTPEGVAAVATLDPDMDELVVTIIDDDADRVQFETTSYSVDEGDGTVTLTVVRSGTLEGPASVDYATLAGTAAAGSDYVAVNDTLTFIDGQASKDIDIQIIQDAITEGSQTFSVVLSNPQDTILGANEVATVTITDSAGTFRFNPSSYTVVEDVANGTVTLTVERINGTTGAASVDYATSAGTASAVSDYVGETGTLIFGNGDSSESIVIEIVDNATVEGAEAFTVVLSDPVGAILGSPSTATVNITDDDGVGTFAFSAADYSAVENTGTVTITVLRQGTTVGAASVQYSTSAGTATAGTDYTQIASTTLNFIDGQSSASFTVTIQDDVASETNETVNLALSNPSSGFTLGAQQTAVLTIVDNETQQPIITGITPTEGPSTGGNLVTITGTNLLGATQVLFGSATASISNATNTQVLVIAPAGTPGAVNVRVTTPVGTSVVTTNGVYTYLPVPVVTGVSPQNGPVGGGTAVTITGSNFTGATQVLFGNTAASSFSIISNTQINAVSPAGAAGDVQVRVQNANGLSATSLATRFTYGTAASPTVTIELATGWSFKTWLGKNGITPSQALHGMESPDNPATNDVYNIVTVIWYWNGVQWLAFFPAGVNVPGANTLTSMPYGQPIWVYLNTFLTNWVTVQGP